MAFPPGPKLLPIVGSFRLIKRPYELLEQCYEKYGDVFTVPITRLGNVVFIADPDAVKGVFTHLAKKFHSGEANRFLAPFLGDFSLILLDGPEHGRQRRLLLPAFQGERMKLFADLMRDCSYEMIKKWRVGEAVMMRQEMQAVTLRVIVESIFGQDMSRRTPEIIALVRGFLQIPMMTLLTFLPFLRVNLGAWSPWGRFLKVRKNLDRLILDEIARRRAAPKSEPEDLLDLLMLSRDEEGREMTAEEIRDECLTLMLAGHETTAISLTWAFATLLRSPQVMEKIIQEHKAVVGDCPVSVDLLPKLTYLEATIRESLRINNLFPIVVRKALEPVEIKGYNLPAGTIVAPCNLLIHQLPELYPDPKEFKPERFLAGEREHPYGWFPFGGGPRRCIGMNFALFEMKMILASILPFVEMELLPGQQFKPERQGLTLAPPTGVRVRIKAVREIPSRIPQPVL